jgi:hypothetical protein
MKILFLMDSPEYLRFYDSAIEELAARGHTVALAVNSGRAKKPVGLEGLHTAAGSVTVLGIVPAHSGMWGGIGRGVRGTMDFVRFLHPRFAEATALRARIKRRVLPRAYYWLDAVPRLRPGAVHAVERGLMAMERAVPVCRPIAAFLHEQAPDVLLLSPLVAAASDQVDWVKAARQCGIRTAVCIASWDNLTNKGLLRIEPDLVIVWNEAQRQEAHQYHYIPLDKIAATGAQLFDRWFTRTPTRDREAFCARVGFTDSRPFLLFMGSSGFISESNAEVGFVRKWIAAVRASGDPLVASCNILVRPHPYNFEAWESAPLSDLPGVSVFPNRPYSPIDADNRDDFFDSVYHCGAVIGINTSAMIEAAIVGRPVLSMFTEQFAATQEGTIHFHHLLPENGGCVRMAATLEEHIRQLRDQLANPESTRVETARFVSSFVRPHGVERPATPMFADAVEHLGRQPPPASRPASSMAVLLRPLVLAAAAPVPIVDWFVKPTALLLARKWARGALWRGRKRLRRSVLRWQRGNAR